MLVDVRETFTFVETVRVLALDAGIEPHGVHPTFARDVNQVVKQCGAVAV